MSRRITFLVVLTTSLIAARARAMDGFVAGFEVGYGAWNLNGNNVTSYSSLYTPGDAAAFAQTVQGGNFDLNLHLGYNFFGHVALEAVIQGTSWNTFNSGRGGAGFGGGRITWYPLQIFLSPYRHYDVGLEFGAGYSIAGGPSPDGYAGSPDAGPSFGMDGYYLALGVVGEYRVSRSVGLTLAFRYFMPNWNRFYLNYNEGISAQVSGMSAGWAAFTFGVNLHVPNVQPYY